MHGIKKPNVYFMINFWHLAAPNWKYQTMKSEGLNYKDNQSKEQMNSKIIGYYEQNRKTKISCKWFYYSNLFPEKNP